MFYMSTGSLITLNDLGDNGPIFFEVWLGLTSPGSFLVVF